MFRHYSAVVLLIALLLSPFASIAQQRQQTQTQSPSVSQTEVQRAERQAGSSTQPASDPIARIRDEGMNRSQVMETLSYMTDVIGPRLTNSPNMKRANEWTAAQMTKWGLNAQLEPWGPFGRGWSLKRFSAQVIEPQAIPLIAYPKAWSPSTNGAVTADVVYLNANNEAELAAFKGKLNGAIVLTAPIQEVKALFEAPSSRRDEKNLLALADMAEARPRRRNFQMTPEQRAALQFNATKARFLHDEGAAIWIEPSRIGDGGTIFVQGATVPQAAPAVESQGARPRAPRAYDMSAPKITPQVILAVEHYNRILRMIEAGDKVRMTVDLAVEWHDADLMGYNTIAEIPGTDLKDEIVMLGGHLDSWHSGTGATDNAAGCAVAMEAVRIIQALGLKPRRTIRVALWSGEEQGLLGSAAYVAKHFGKFETPTVSSSAGNGSGNGSATTPAAPVLVKRPDYDNLSAYFNLDNGTGRIRGVYMQGNDTVRSLFREWLAPFHDLGASTLTISNTGGTDHLSFDAIGLPGFQFIQDEIEYDTRTHHSNQDVFDRIQAEDMKQASTIMAAFVYNAAMRDEKLPRKPVPAPPAPRQQ